MQRVSIIVLCHNQLAHTQACLAALRATVVPADAELVFADNGSTDGTAAWLAQQEGLRVVMLPDNLGFGPGNNAAAATCTTEFLLFLNNDTEPRTDWLTALVAALDADAGAAAAGARLLAADGTLLECGSVVNSDCTCTNRGRGAQAETPVYLVPRAVPYASACCLLVRRKAFAAAGGFAARFAPAYYEDVDLCRTLHATGHRVLVVPQAAVVHHENATARALSGGDGPRRQLQERHRLVYAEKWQVALPAVRPRRIALLIPYNDPSCTWGEVFCAAQLREALEWRPDVADVRVYDYATAGAIRDFAPDLLVSLSAWRQHLRLGARMTLFWLLNYAHEFLPAGMQLTDDDALAMDADLYMANSERAVAHIARQKPAALLHMAANPYQYAPLAPRDEYRAPVVYLGAYTPGHKGEEFVRRYLEPALPHGLQIWGVNWEQAPPALRARWRGELPPGDVPALYASADIALGITAANQRAAGMVNNRVFEIASCGTLLLSDDTPAVRALLGDAALYTGGGEETDRLLAEWLVQPERRAALGARARQLIVAGHTYEHRAAALLAFYEAQAEGA